MTQCCTFEELNIKASMQLSYSLSDIAPEFLPGDVPDPGLRDAKVKVSSIEGVSNGAFPLSYHTIGTLMCQRRKATNEFAITLRLDYVIGFTPPATGPTILNEWAEAPNSPRIGQIRIALTPEAIGRIQKSLGEGYNYELNLTGIRLVDTARP